MNQSQKIWDEEYSRLMVIPSSNRVAPSKALLLFSELLDIQNKHRVLDAGCGNGRNTIYFAKAGCFVDAIDSANTALEKLKLSALEAGVGDRITIHHQSLQPIFPFENCNFDLVIDSYVFCHIIEDGLREEYRDELYRVTRPGGLLYSSVISIDDGYYDLIGNFDTLRSDIVTDPNNMVTKKLYTLEEVKAFFGVQFEVKYAVRFEFQDTVLNNSYTRCVLALILRRPA